MKAAEKFSPNGISLSVAYLATVIKDSKLLSTMYPVEYIILASSKQPLFSSIWSIVSVHVAPRLAHRLLPSLMMISAQVPVGKSVL